MAEMNVKMILTDDEGEVQELEGKAIIFFLVQSEQEVGEETLQEAMAGVFGSFSPPSINAARDGLLQAIDNSEAGKKAKLARELEDMLKKLGDTRKDEDDEKPEYTGAFKVGDKAILKEKAMPTVGFEVGETVRVTQTGANRNYSIQISKLDRDVHGYCNDEHLEAVAETEVAI